MYISIHYTYNVYLYKIYILKELFIKCIIF